ncbi:MAG: choice-of-anchor J domain-containing protein [Flavobacteriaceae bacterium]|jgi:gliding motility-associated-like protein|nr:choice-of-anchor J domain-containing protein [Flavobacteriaceae bacterium]
MKLKLRLTVGTIVLLFGALLFAKDTIGTIYSQYFDQVDQHTTAAAPVVGDGIDPLYAGKSIFMDDFEGSSKWTMINNATNAWYIDTAIAQGGKKSLYISDSKGSTNTYSNSVKTLDVSFAISSSFVVPANTSNYILSFDWRCNGEGSPLYGDDVNVWIVPDTYTPTVDVKMTAVNSGGILVKDKLVRQMTFKKENIAIDLTSFAGKSVKLIYQWFNNSYTNNQPPAAIDNIVLYPETCKIPSNLQVSQITRTDATLKWTAPNTGVANYEIILTADEAYPKQALVPITVNSTTYTFTNLVASTYYYAWYRSVCSTTDKSYWVGPVKFMTVCGEFNAPFYETFDTNSPNVECWTFVNNNPKDNNKFELTTGYKMEGDRGLMFRSYDQGAHDSYAITPTFNFNGGLYKLTYYYKTSPSYNNEFEVLLSKDGKDITKFTTTLVAKKIYQKSDYVKETVFINGIIGQVNLAWHVNSINESTFHLENVRLENVQCTEPLRLTVNDIKTNSAKFKWDDAIANEWEYAIVGTGTAAPTNAGLSTTQNNVTASQDATGATLTPDTSYDFYVRAKCLDGSFGPWSGPLYFKTACVAKNVPYRDGFEVGETDLACWTINDVNKDGTAYGNIWKTSPYTVYQGKQCMYYSGSSPVNDDWLITPGFNLNGGLYAVTFYYQINQNTTANLEVKVSTTGTDPSSFTQTIGTTLPYVGPFYTKKIVYVENITGLAHIGFHVTGKSGAIQIDDFSIEQVTCRAPEDLITTSIGTTTADIAWTDGFSKQWEYYVMEDNGGTAGPAAAGSGATSTKATINRVNGTNAALQPNKAYKVFVRSSCGTGKYSEWVGPLKFRTGCEIMPIPYQEGFNSDSLTQYCWKIVDGNNDKPWYGGFGEWFATDQKAYEGDRSMYFTNQTAENDDWLMSPLFKFDKNKIYRVTYMYRTDPGTQAEFEVRLSNTGREKQNFTRVLLPNASYDNVPWKQQKFLLSGIDGEVSIAFWVTKFKNRSSRTYVDDFRIEEVTTCTEPLVQGADKITGTSAEIYWDNDFGTTKWEYFVRKKAFLIAPPLTNGTVATTNRVAVTKDNFGGNLEGNTWYEFYVRTLCNDGSKTVWTGPYYFRTECTFSTLPYWEGFNGDDNSLRCWTMTNGNTGASAWKQTTTTPFEGSHVMNYTQAGAAESNDWFISPLFKNLDPTKTYRVKFNYKGTGTGTNEMEVVASTKGIATTNFTKVIAPRASYTAANYKDAIYYFTGVAGDMNLAFHVVGTGAKNITIDNLFIDELTTCGQPYNMGVKNILPTSVNLTWQTDFGATAWEYMIQETKQIPPTAKDAGIATTSSDFVATKDITGKNLEGNTDYVYYARTVCGNGKYSEWSGPIAFTTACGIYTVPFTAGFNTNSKQLRCWTIAQGPAGTTAWATNGTWPYEGNGLMQFKQTGATTKADGYLISPTINLVAGSNYVLKYYYKTDLANRNEFEVLLSSTGNAISGFTTTLLGKKAYANDNYIQETVFISGVSGNVNIAWHTVGVGPMTLSLDYVTIEKAEACASPSNVKVNNYTATTVDVEWDASPGVTQWEVYASEYGTAIPTGATGTIVNGTPKYTITNLTSGKAYQVYVRAKCAGRADWSSWTGPANAPTRITTNGDCSGALTIPVNAGIDCVQKIGVSTIDSPKNQPNTFTKCMNGNQTNEMWFEFTATSTTHLISFGDLIGVKEIAGPSIAYELYSGACGPQIMSSPAGCDRFDSIYGTPSKDDSSTTFKDLIPGHKYYMRVTMPAGDFMYTICITTGSGNYVTVSKNGDKYTTEELVKDVLIKSDCDLVSNVKYQAGPKSGGNTFGYFNKNGSLFPFEEGIILATHDIANAPGPYYDYGDAGRRGKLDAWEGDADLNAVISSAGGSVYNGNKSVSIVEFDFIPVKDEIKFEYLMASESYLHNCTVVCWGAGALFAAWLTEIETGQGQNLALVPGTKEPITLSTVRDSDRSGARCENVHPEYFGKYFGNGQDNPLLAPVNYIGMTKPMSSEPIHVKPGTKYRIKLAIADFCTASHVSAVFFNAKSFDLGTLDLGPDLTVEANTAVCNTESKIIRSGLLTENVEISWKKDGKVIPGETKPDLEVKEAGAYTVVAHYAAIKCDVEGDVKVEMFKPLDEIIHKAEPIQYCRYVIGGVSVNLTQNEAAMFNGLDRSKYTMTYYATAEDAKNATNAITTPATHKIQFSVDVQKRYMLIEDLVTGCSAVFTVDLVSAEGQKPAKPNDVKVCAVYEFPKLAANQSYYTGPGATGDKYLSGDKLSAPGTHTIYVFQDNGNGCYEEVSFEISITAPIYADVIENVQRDCEVYELPKLSKHNRYFTQSGGKGVELFPGMKINTTQHIYIYAISDDGLCSDEREFTITYTDCPIPQGISPNGDGVNDTFDLSAHGVESVKIFNRLGSEVYSYGIGYTNQWNGQDKNGKVLPVGTYYYVVVAQGKVRTGWVQINR